MPDPKPQPDAETAAGRKHTGRVLRVWAHVEYPCVGCGKPHHVMGYATVRHPGDGTCVLDSEGEAELYGDDETRPRCEACRKIERDRVIKANKASRVRARFAGGGVLKLAGE